jgi:hypothetical protein
MLERSLLSAGGDKDEPPAEEEFMLDPTLPEKMFGIPTDKLFSRRCKRMLDTQSNALTAWTTSYVYDSVYESDQDRRGSHPRQWFDKKHSRIIFWKQILTFLSNLPRLVAMLHLGITEIEFIIFSVSLEVLLFFTRLIFTSECVKAWWKKKKTHRTEFHDESIFIRHKIMNMEGFFSIYVLIVLISALAYNIHQSMLQYPVIGGGLAHRRHISNFALITFYWTLVSYFMQVVDAKSAWQNFNRINIYKRELSPVQARWVETEIRESLRILKFWRVRIPWNREILGLRVDESRSDETDIDHKHTKFLDKCAVCYGTCMLFGILALLLLGTTALLVYFTIRYHHTCWSCPTQLTRSDPCPYPDGYPKDYYFNGYHSSDYVCGIPPP